MQNGISIMQVRDGSLRIDFGCTILSDLPRFVLRRDGYGFGSGPGERGVACETIGVDVLAEL